MEDLLDLRCNFVDTKMEKIQVWESSDHITSNDLCFCFVSMTKRRDLFYRIVQLNRSEHQLMYSPTDANHECDLRSFWNVDVSSFLCFACLLNDISLQFQVGASITLSTDQILTFTQRHLRLQDSFAEKQVSTSCQSSLCILQFRLGNCGQFFVLRSSCCWLGCWFSSWCHPKSTELELLELSSSNINNFKTEKKSRTNLHVLLKNSKRAKQLREPEMKQKLMRKMEKNEVKAFTTPNEAIQIKKWNSEFFENHWKCSSCACNLTAHRGQTT